MKTESSGKKYVADDGVEITYWTTWSKEMDKEFFFLHPGGATNHSCLERLEKGLNERGHPTVIFDPRGSGYSDAPIRPEYYQLERLSGDLEGIMTKEGLERPRIFAHSFGFMPAIDYAARTKNAEHITGVCASHKFSETTPNKLLFKLFDAVLVYNEYLGSMGTRVAHLLRGTQRGCPDQSNPKSDIDLWTKMVDIPFRNATAHAVGQQTYDLWDITPQLGMLETPLLLIYGEKDLMVLPKAGPLIVERTHAPISVEIVKNAAHSLPIMLPEKVLEIMEKHDAVR